MALQQNDPRINELEAAEVKFSDAVRGLLACAKVCTGLLIFKHPNNIIIPVTAAPPA